MRLILFITIILFSCGKTSSDCGFGASSPIDLTLANDCDSDKEVSFYYYDTSDNDFELIKTVTVDKKEGKTICIDNEGQVTEGLYIKMTDRTKMIKLKWGQEFKLRLCDNSFVIERNKGPK